MVSIHKATSQGHQKCWYTSAAHDERCQQPTGPSQRRSNGTLLDDWLYLRHSIRTNPPHPPPSLPVSPIPPHSFPATPCLPPHYFQPPPPLLQSGFSGGGAALRSGCNVRFRLQPHLLPTAFTAYCPLIQPSVHRPPMLSLCFLSEGAGGGGGLKGRYPKTHRVTCLCLQPGMRYCSGYGAMLPCHLGGPDRQGLHNHSPPTVGNGRGCGATSLHFGDPNMTVIW